MKRYRGGGAHRQDLGVECEIWRCERCGLIFPNPMPVPVGGLDQHYAVPPEEYFQNHDPGDKDNYAAVLIEQLQSLGIQKRQAP